MTNPEVLIVTSDADDYVDLLNATPEPAVPYIACPSAADARTAYKDHRVLFGSPGLIVDVLTDMPAVEWVQSTWAGITPLLAAGRSDYILTGVKGIFGPLMAEYVLGYMLANELRILQRAEFQRRREWVHDVSGNLRDKHVGIMGTGSIGAHIASVVRQFRMRVSGLSNSGNVVDNFDAVYPTDRIDEFLRDLDYLVAVLPDTPGTDRLLAANAFAELPERAILINVGRANVIDHSALVAALDAGMIAGAVLDVFEQEPLPMDSPLWTAPNLLVTGHVAAHSYPADITPIFLRNYRRFVAGESLEFVVDFARGY